MKRAWFYLAVLIFLFIPAIASGQTPGTVTHIVSSSSNPSGCKIGDLHTVSSGTVHLDLCRSSNTWFSTVLGTGTTGKIPYFLDAYRVGDSPCGFSGSDLSCSGAGVFAGTPAMIGTPATCPAAPSLQGSLCFDSSGNRPRYAFNAGSYSDMLLASDKNVANGVPGLDSSGKIPASEIPASGSGGFSSFTALTDGSTVTWNGSSANNASLSMNHSTSTRAINFSGFVSGQRYTLLLKQDATGGAALTFGSGCTAQVEGAGAGLYSPTSAANAIDVLYIDYDGSNCYVHAHQNFTSAGGGGGGSATVTELFSVNGTVGTVAVDVPIGAVVYTFQTTEGTPVTSTITDDSSNSYSTVLSAGSTLSGAGIGGSWTKVTSGLTGGVSQIHSSAGALNTFAAYMITPMNATPTDKTAVDSPQSDSTSWSIGPTAAITGTNDICIAGAVATGSTTFSAGSGWTLLPGSNSLADARNSSFEWKEYPNGTAVTAPFNSTGNVGGGGTLECLKE